MTSPFAGTGCRIREKTAVTLLVCIVLTGISFGEDTPSPDRGRAGFHFLEEPVDARSIGMGCTGTASWGQGGAYYNPARMLLDDFSYASVQYGRQPGDLGKPRFEGVWRTEEWAVGLSVKNHTISGIIPANEQGRMENLAFSSPASLGALTAGFRRERFGVAVSLNAFEDRIYADAGYFGVSGSAGIIWESIPSKLTFGLAGFHQGISRNRALDGSDWGGGVEIPRTGRAGVAWSDSRNDIRYRCAMDVVYHDVDESFTVPVGVEGWLFQDRCAVRLGKRVGHDTNLFSCGAGVRVFPLQCDVSYELRTLGGTLEPQWCVGLLFMLPAGA